MTLIEFRQQILIRLGSPVINIEIASEQMDLYISDTVNKFIETHYDGLDEGVIFLDLTADEDEYTLPNNIHSALEIFSLSSSLIMDEPLLVHPYLVGNVTYSYSNTVLDLILFQQNVAQYQDIIKDQKLFEFNTTTHILKLLEIPTKDERIAIRVHASPTDLELLYENIWVSKYATALCKLAWGQNIGKFAGATLPGGVQLDYQRIIEEANQEIEKLDLELIEKYQEPINPIF